MKAQQKPPTIQRRRYTLRQLVSAGNILIVDGRLAEVHAATVGGPIFSVSIGQGQRYAIAADFTQVVTLELHLDSGSSAGFLDAQGAEHHIQFFKGYDLEFEDVEGTSTKTPDDPAPFTTELHIAAAAADSMSINGQIVKVRFDQEPGLLFFYDPFRPDKWIALAPADQKVAVANGKCWFTSRYIKQQLELTLNKDNPLTQYHLQDVDAAVAKLLSGR